jgi:hypothetical protein
VIPIPKLELTAASLKLIVAIGCALLLALLIHDRNHWKAKTAQYAERLAAERGAHSATVAGYRAAAAQARAADAANAARVKADQAAINERTADDYQNRIAAARAAAGGLRRTAGAATDPGGGGATPVPGLSAAAARAAESAGQDGLSPPERLIATEQAIQLDELIHWVKAQREVEVGGR